MMSRLAPALVALAALSAPAAATTVSAVQALTSQGGTLNFNFGALGPSNGGNGLLTILGNDVDIGAHRYEWMSIGVDGDDYGRWVCDDTPTAPGQHIAGSVGANHCDFSLPVTLPGGALGGYLSDGIVGVVLRFGGFVNPNPGTTLAVTLSYDDPAPVPLPAGGLLLLAGLGGLAVAGRRRRAAR